jgi:hypothetical protein
VIHDDPLSTLALLYETDKARDHWYTPHYHSRFNHLRDYPVHLLEIGIGGYDDPAAGGESMRMWRDYFTHPDAVIVGIDIIEKKPIDGCIIEQADQSNPEDLHRLGDTYGPFDIVVDDGSHRPNDIMQSWVILWDYLTVGGWYCIEDLQASYWPPFGGSSVRTGDTVIGFLQGLIDRIHYAELDIPGYTPNRFDLTMVGLEISRNLAFLLKGDNSDPSNIMPPHPHEAMFNHET